MSKQQHSVLFVSHTADRNGAPLILLGIIQEFKKQSSLPFRILVMKDGELTPEFESAGETMVWEKKGSRNFFKKLVGAIRKRIILFNVRDTSIVFLNTIANGHIQEKLSLFKPKFICYVHELETVIRRATNEHTRKVVLKNTHFFLSGSEAVKKNLITNHNVEAGRIKVVYSSMPKVFRAKTDHAEYIGEFRNKHNISIDAVVIGIAGSSEWRKGFDLFFPLIRIYFNLFPGSNVYFVWKGFKSDAWTSFNDLYDYNKLNERDRALLMPHGNDSIEQIACYDIHLLLSREDPYPLVVLEAASFGIPTVCFADAGGSPEFVGADSGYCVPYGDLLAMAERLNELVNNASLRNKMGLNALNKVQTHHDQQSATREVIEVVENLLYESKHHYHYL
jgi:glycosyltransferase involved in cell wall biosynthesis